MKMAMIDDDWLCCNIFLVFYFGYQKWGETSRLEWRCCLTLATWSPPKGLVLLARACTPTLNIVFNMQVVGNWCEDFFRYSKSHSDSRVIASKSSWLDSEPKSYWGFFYFWLLHCFDLESIKHLHFDHNTHAITQTKMVIWLLKGLLYNTCEGIFHIIFL